MVISKPLKALLDQAFDQCKTKQLLCSLQPPNKKKIIKDKTELLNKFDRLINELQQFRNNMDGPSIAVPTDATITSIINCYTLANFYEPNSVDQIKRIVGDCLHLLEENPRKPPEEIKDYNLHDLEEFQDSQESPDIFVKQENLEPPNKKKKTD